MPLQSGEGPQRDFMKAIMRVDEPKERTRDLEAQAEMLEESGLLQEAVGKWREVVVQRPSAVAFSQLGRLATALNEPEEAERAYLDSITLDPSWSLPYEALAILYRDAGDLQKAQAYLRLSLGLERKARTLTFLGDILERLGRDSEAESALREATTIDPSYSEAHFLLGRVLREDPKVAIPHYRRALELDPDYALAHRELGWALRRLGQLDEAEEHVRRAIALGDREIWPLIHLGNILWRKGDFEGAKGAFEEAIAADPSNSTGYWCLADLLKAQGQESEARRLLRKSLRVGISDPQANLRYGLLMRDVGEHRKAKRYFKRVLELDADNVVARRALQDV